MDFRNQLIEIKNNIHNNENIEISIQNLISIVNQLYKDEQKDSIISSLEENKNMLLSNYCKAVVDVFNQIYTLIIQRLALGV